MFFKKFHKGKDKICPWPLYIGLKSNKNNEPHYLSDICERNIIAYAKKFADFVQETKKLEKCSLKSFTEARTKSVLSHCVDDKKQQK
jgi:hypothetical protein